MLNRQKVLAEMLRAAARPVSRPELMTWCFLLRHEMPSRGGPSFYEFLPYDDGPFSFGLAREARAMAEGGLLVETETSWGVAPESEMGGFALPGGVGDDMRQVVGRFRTWPVDELIDYVDRNHPAFTVNRKRGRRRPRPVGTLAVYTAGYEGSQVDGFLNLLVHHGIGRLIDVRNNPVSRRYGFHKTTLGRLCGHLGIDYRHVPELGIPPALRHDLRRPADHEALFRRYEVEMLPGQPGAIEVVVGLVGERPSVLVCKEADPLMCHRSRLARVVAERVDLPVVHLGPAGG